MKSVWIVLQFSTIFHAGLVEIGAVPQGFGLPWFHPPWVAGPVHAMDPLQPPPPPFPPLIYNDRLPDVGNYYPTPEELDDFQQTLRLGNTDDDLALVDFDDELFRQNGQTDDSCSRRRWRKTICFNATTIQICKPNGSPISRQCPNGLTCASGRCRKPRRSLRPFTCPGAGFFPDPHTCKAYHVCQSADNNGSPVYTATNVTCYWPQVYDPESQSCQREGRDTPCYRFNCAGRSAVAYPGDPNIYATCSSGGRVVNLMRCLANYGWDDVQQQCVTPYCTQEGNIPAPNSQTMYYTCTRVFKRLVRSELKTCPNNIPFNTNLGICSANTQQTVLTLKSQVSQNDTSVEDSSNYDTIEEN